MLLRLAPAPPRLPSSLPSLPCPALPPPLRQYDDPVLLASDVEKREGTVRRVCEPILAKKPPPPPKPEAVPAAAPGGEELMEEEAGPPPPAGDDSQESTPMEA